MKKLFSLALSVIITLSCLSIGISCVSIEITDKIKKEQLNSMWTQMIDFDGEVGNRLIVKSKKDIDYINAVNVASGYDDTYYLQFSCEQDLIDAMDYYNSLGYVKSVERETVAYCDEDDNLDSKCYATSNSNIDDALKLIDTYYSDLPEIKIAVIDTGVENSDVFGDRVVGGYDSLSYNDYHGSYVAGTVLYNTLNNVKIYSYKAGTGQEVGLSNAAIAIDKAVSDGCQIINMSFSADKGDASLLQSIQNANSEDIILLGSAGNQGIELTSSVRRYPCGYSQVLSVGNMSTTKTLYKTSNYGSGVDYYVTGTLVRSNYRNEDIYWTGTSASTPIVASIIANMLTVNPDLSSKEIKTILSSSKSLPNEDNTNRYILDAYSAIEMASGKELSTADFDYTVTENEATGFSDITFSCDKDIRIYCYIASEGSQLYPINSEDDNTVICSNGSKISLGDEYVINAVACSDNKAKSILKHIVAPNYNNDDFDYRSSNDGVVDNSISYCRLTDSSVLVPSEVDGNVVEKIASYCFAGNKSIEEIIIPETVKEIEAYAFSGCTNLKKVICKGVTKCGIYAFENCTNLLEVVMPNVTSTHTGMFMNCPSLLITEISEQNMSNLDYNGAYLNTENLLNYYQTKHKYCFNSFENGNVVYKCSDCKQYITESSDDILYMWNDYYFNKPIPTSDFETTEAFNSTSLFDINCDGIVNAKDYAMLNRAI